MKLHNLAPLMVTGALLAPAANAQHKTGLDFQFDLGLTNKQDDSTVEGDKTSLQFKQRRARWWLGGKFQDKFSYKFRFKFKSGGAVGLSYVKAGYKLSDATSVTFGRDFDPIPLSSVVGDSYRMSDSNVSSAAADAFNTGEVGVQLATDVGVGKLKFGIANGNEITAAGYTTALDSFAVGVAFEGGFGIFSPYIGIGIQNTPSEKVKATGLKFKGRNDVQVSVGAGLDFGATDVLVNFARRETGEAKIENAAGVETVAQEKEEVQGFEARVVQDFTSKLTGSAHYSFDTFKTDGKKTKELQQIAAQLFMYPYAKKEAFFVFTLANILEKPEGKKDFTTNEASVAFAAKPSFAIAKK